MFVQRYLNMLELNGDKALALYEPDNQKMCSIWTTSNI
ncbi:hypothetical protein THOM_0988 [Trachipleistophora hominis]|uniref:Uncharacterized protein n=1 Tax=Trachipleistophora hominis TaxID=72359 RepID=L7JZ44_TRAHO|nr:hypothetical protein THOM_0988 [Trachipleistophora hominis]